MTDVELENRFDRIDARFEEFRQEFRQEIKEIRTDIRNEIRQAMHELITLIESVSQSLGREAARFDLQKRVGDLEKDKHSSS